MKIRILIDPQGFLMQRYGGVSRQMIEFYTRFLANENFEIRCPVLYSENQYLAEAKLAPRFFSFFHKIRFRGKGKLLHYTLDKCSFKMVIAELKRQQFDVFFPTYYYDTYFLKYLKQKPFVVTIHDMIHELFPEYFSQDRSMINNKLILMQHAARIIAVSQNTKNDILKLYPFLDADKIDVVHVCHSIAPEYKEVKDLPENYILFVGSRRAYKNFKLLAEAISPILKSDPALILLCAGGGAFSGEEKKWLEENGLTNKVIQRNFFTDELASYYKKARLFVFPSAYEGFGLPVLEAMYFGCPVVLTNYSSFPEVAGDAGIFFELNNKEDMAKKVLSILNDESLRQEYIEKGKLQVEKFSWTNTAKKWEQTMKSVVN
jgi:glycosyltransferase involved in cell wall biosynthesis